MLKIHPDVSHFNEQIVLAKAHHCCPFVHCTLLEKVKQAAPCLKGPFISWSDFQIILKHLGGCIIVAMEYNLTI